MGLKLTAIDLFSELIKLDSKWQISSIETNDDTEEITINVNYVNKTAKCPKTQEDCKIYDKQAERRWRHLDTCQYKTFISCRVPRVKNSNGEVSVIDIPWAEACDRITFFLSDL